MQVVRGLAGIDAQIIHGAGVAAHAHRAEVAADARAGIDQDFVGQAGAVDAIDRERDAVAQRDAAGRDGRAARARRDIQGRVIGHADIARHRQGRRTLHRQHAAGPGHAQVAAQAAGRARDFVAELQCAAGHLSRTAERAEHHQLAVPHLGVAGVRGMIAGQFQCARSGLRQHSVSVEGAAKGSAAQLLEHQRASVLDIATNGIRVANHHARLDPGIAVGVARVAQAQRTRAGLDEVATTRHPTRQSEREAGRHVDAAGLRQRDGARGRKGVRDRQPAAVEHHSARGIPQVLVAIDLQRATGDHGAAGIAIAAAQNQRAIARLGQRPAVPALCGIGRLVGERQAHVESAQHIGQRERAVGQVVVGHPAWRVGCAVLQAVGRLVRIDREIVHGTREAAHVHRGEIPADAIGGIDEHRIELALVGNAAQFEGHAVAQRDGIGAQGRPAGAGPHVQDGALGQAEVARHRQRRGALHRQRAAGAGHAQIAGQAISHPRRAVAVLQGAAGHFRRTAQRAQHHQLAARHRGLALEAGTGASQDSRAGNLVQALGYPPGRTLQRRRKSIGRIRMIEVQRGNARAELDRTGIERARTHGRQPRRRTDVEGAGGGKDQEPVQRQRHGPRAGRADVDGAALPDRQGARSGAPPEPQVHRAAVVPGGAGTAHRHGAVAAHAAHIAVAVRDRATRLDVQGALAGYVAHPELTGIGPGRTAPRHQEIAVAVLIAPDDAVNAGDIPARQDRHGALAALRADQQRRAIVPERSHTRNRDGRRAVLLRIDRGELVQDRALIEDAQVPEPAAANEQVACQGPGRARVVHVDPGRGARRRAGIDPALRGAQYVGDLQGSARDGGIAVEPRIVAQQ
ncbi:hypothetical protein AGI3411_05323 [Achromobacter agilis]|uniref:Uncharacterized protein n=1 Tax=Achromobacter agilis TaxID=1353888 RepID=A0A446CVK9_9BURK|nr:hypothetical protein AGI3411_05323 [Achromobacter agilis]